MVAKIDILPRTRETAKWHPNVKINIDLGYLSHPSTFDFHNKTYNYPYSQKEISFFRGYTSHEHLLGQYGGLIVPHMEIINMNGRIYDPILAQFMQADNNVATPENYIGYDRYAYCLNNPLKMTDPSGEFIFTTLAAIFCQPLLPMAMSLDWAWMSGGMRSMEQGKGFWYGALRGVVTGVASYGLGKIAPAGGFLGGAFVGAGTGLVNSVLWGDDPRLGVITGGLMGGLFGGLESALSNDSFIDGSGIDYLSDGSGTDIQEASLEQYNEAKGFDAEVNDTYSQVYGLRGKKDFIGECSPTVKHVKLAIDGSYITTDGNTTGYCWHNGNFKTIKIGISPKIMKSKISYPNLYKECFHHEFIHYYHQSKLGRNYVSYLSERSSYKFSVDFWEFKGNYERASGLQEKVMQISTDGNSWWGDYPSQYNAPDISNFCWPW